MDDSSSAAPRPAGEPPERPHAVRFGVFEVDFDSAELRKRGLRVRLQEQPFRVLSLLLEQPGRVVSREELQSRLWPGDTFVDFDHGLNTTVNKIRQALGDSAANPRFIETMHRRGYRFIAPVERVGVEAGPAATAASAETAPTAAIPTAAVIPPTTAIPAAPVQTGAPVPPAGQAPAVGPGHSQATPSQAIPPGTVPSEAFPSGTFRPEERIPAPTPSEADLIPPATEGAANLPPWRSAGKPRAGATDPSIRRWFQVGGVVVFSVVIVFAVITVVMLFGAIQQRLSHTFDSEPERIAPAVVSQVRILAGQTSDYVSPSDKHWFGDRYFVGGEASRRSGVVVGAADTNLFRGERYGRFQYVIPAMPREYRLTMHFAETWFGSGNQGGGGPGNRVFDVECNGTYLLRGFDIFREAGGANRAITRSFDGITTNEQGSIVITFLPRANNGMINALELTPME